MQAIQQKSDEDQEFGTEIELNDDQDAELLRPNKRTDRLIKIAKEQMSLLLGWKALHGKVRFGKLQKLPIYHLRE